MVACLLKVDTYSRGLSTWGLVGCCNEGDLEEIQSMVTVMASPVRTVREEK